MRVPALAAAALSLLAVTAAPASADVFNGRIAFTSFRVDQPTRTGDIFTMNADGTDLRQLTDNPADDAQSDWAPDGRDIAYRIRKPGFTINFEVARMPASARIPSSGDDHLRLTFTPDGQASSQPSWFPDRRAMLFRRSGPGAIASIWRMGTLGEDPVLLFDPPGQQLYPSLSPDMTRILFTTTVSPRGDTDRAIQLTEADGTGLRTLFNVAGAFDSAPAWSPDGSRIAFESNADVAGGNPERDMEIWVMDADGGQPTQITHNGLHDEGPAWSPDGTMFAYSSGADNNHLDINVMTTAGVHLARLTDYEGRDESPDWQPIPAPETERTCGDVGAVRDVRAAGRRLSCWKALNVAARWSRSQRRDKVKGFDAQVEDFGGVWRVILTHRGHSGKLVAFLYQP